jgi:hypothetical protein
LEWADLVQNEQQQLMHQQLHCKFLLLLAANGCQFRNWIACSSNSNSNQESSHHKIKIHNLHFITCITQ